MGINFLKRFHFYPESFATGLVTGAILVLIFNSSIVQGALTNTIKALPLRKQPETFTELYFTDHLNLPKEIELETPYSFEFSVHNQEHQDFTYTYEVTTNNQESTQVIVEGLFFLEHNEKKTIPVTFQISPPFERIKITVNLVNKNQPIHFWVEQEED